MGSSRDTVIRYDIYLVIRTYEVLILLEGSTVSQSAENTPGTTGCVGFKYNTIWSGVEHRLYGVNVGPYSEIWQLIQLPSHPYVAHEKSRVYKGWFTIYGTSKYSLLYFEWYCSLCRSSN